MVSLTLMTRGMKGCYIYCVNKELQEYLKSKINKYPIIKPPVLSIGFDFSIIKTALSAVIEELSDE